MAEFEEPRLTTVYDAECRWGRDDDFFLAAVEEVPASRVLDLGCGTGRLTVALAAEGHTVTGVDPAGASLQAAQAKPGADLVTWIQGRSDVLGRAVFDTVVMTSHVAQFLVTDEEWRDTLADLARALVPGGRLIFDSRDLAARGWERWNPVDFRRRVVLPDGRVAEIWSEVTDVEDGAVSFAHHYLLPDGHDAVSTATLRFRSEAAVRRSLERAGFAVESVYGGWERQPVGSADGELVVTARRR